MLMVVLLAGLHTPPSRLIAADRVDRGLVVFYDFAEGNGRTIHDRSGVGAALDLEIDKPGAARWTKDGTLVIESSATIKSAQPAVKIIEAVKQSNSVSVEAWLKPANNSQSGPARIVSLSSDPSHRNVTLGQDKNVYDVRLRATGSDINGMPSTSSPAKSLKAALQHVVFIREANGAAKIFIDGKKVTDQKVSGDFSNWDSAHKLILANEATGDRPWLGELHLVAVYGRALSAKEVLQNFSAGVKADTAAKVNAAELAAAALFDSRVAPLLAQHCLECHDSAIRNGGLDLSRKNAAFIGGDSGKVIAAGKASQSLLWKKISSNEMPKDREPLSDDEKAVLQKWLDSGAAWSTDFIDPANYVHQGHDSEVWVQRLTIPEYIETVRSAVGVDISREAYELLPPDFRADGFSNTAYNLNIDLKHIEAYGRLAEMIVKRMDVPKFASRFDKKRALDVDKMSDFIAGMGRWLLRGPLEDHEVHIYRGIASTVSSAGGSYDDAVSFMIEAMLQSPRFLYRIENQQGDGSLRAASQYELASRLSYILWGAPPDNELLKAAEEGDLADRAKLEAQVQRMLKDPRTIQRSLQFISEWLDLGRLANLQPNKDRFPHWDSQLAGDMRAETLAYFEEIVWKQNRPLIDLLNAQVTFATPRLAKHYGLKPAGEGLTKYDLSDVPGRGGLLTQASVLTVGGDDASMVSRGLFVLNDLLRGTINAPPPCVDTTPPPTKEGLTQRGIAEIRISNVKCGVCHGRFEPLAFGLEKFDGVGAYHEKDDHGNPLREDGEILFPGEAKSVPYKTSAELMNLVAGSPRVRESLTWKVTQFALGRPLTASDASMIAEIQDAAFQRGGTYSDLITAVVLSDLVRQSRTENSP